MVSFEKGSGFRQYTKIFAADYRQNGLVRQAKLGYIGVMKLSRKEFDKAVRRAYSRIPAEILNRMENVVVTVKKRPSKEMLQEIGYPPNETILGLYDGVSLPEHSFFTALPLRPDRIIVFQEPLEEMCDSLAELEREIEITVVHEVAHFLGIGDERLVELGYG
jgi:predicted Zn-dependent protease with MMP-like domain